MIDEGKILLVSDLIKFSVMFKYVHCAHFLFVLGTLSIAQVLPMALCSMIKAQESLCVRLQGMCL